MSSLAEPSSFAFHDEKSEVNVGHSPCSPVVRIPARVRDFNSFRDWTASNEFPQTGRISWFAGEMEIDMNAENISFHSSVKACVGGSLYLLVEKEDLGEFFGDGIRMVHELTQLNCEPDMLFCSWSTLESGRASYQEISADPLSKTELRGTPDCVVEIVSTSSVYKDTQRLRQAYYAAGISEYWLIDARHTEIDFRILVSDSSNYIESARDDEGYQFSRVFQRTFRLTRSRNRVGHWKYHLESQFRKPGATSTGELPPIDG